MKDYRGYSWAVTLPDGWRGRPDPECDTFEAQEDIGALQISSYRKDEPVMDADLEDFASEHIKSGAKLKRVACGSFTGIYLTYGTDDEYWRHWYLRYGSTMLYVTYVCPQARRGEEDPAVSAILDSLHVVEPPERS